jgi:hypothetical protein
MIYDDSINIHFKELQQYRVDCINRPQVRDL